MKWILFIAVLMIGFSSVANAESWVLWSWFPKYENWEIETAFPTYKQCKEFQFEICHKFSFGGEPKGDQKRITERCPDEVTIEYKDGSIGGIFFRCLPDTVDPRK